MSSLLTITIAAWISGITAFIGGVLARLEGTAETTGKRELMHGVTAFGGGILVAAVAFALAPSGIERLRPAVLITLFTGGGALFCVIDIILSRSSGPKAQFLAMMMDFVPEALSLGAVFSHNHRLGILLALFIGAQNLPEGFNAFREMRSGGRTAGAVLLTLFGISFAGPLAALGGFLFLQNRPDVTAGIMTFAGGGILYLIFQDIAPQARMRRHWLPPLGAVLGFLVGMVGKQLLG